MNYKLTSVKIIDKLYKRFKSKIVEDNFTLQKLVNNSIDLFNSDEEFKSKIVSHNYLNVSGSQI